jgi:hypothetical protein
MAAENLTFNTTTVKQTGATGDGIRDWMEVAGSPHIEVIRVMSNESGDWVFTQKIHKVMGISVQNHGATFATGVARDSPQLTITQGSTNSAAKITITHTGTREVFTLIVYGEL